MLIYNNYMEAKLTWDQVNFATSQLQVNGRKLKGASFGQTPFETLSNIGLQVDLTPWIEALRAVTPLHVPEVTSGHEKSPSVFQQ